MSVRSLMIALAALLSAVLGSAASAQDPASPGSIYGVWRNPKNSVHVDVRPCGASACGFVVWANANAQEDARKGGTPQLIGSQLFRNFAQEPNGRWRGKVFVPDLNATFSGSAELLDERRLKARGCLIANIACKSQVWVRVS